MELSQGGWGRKGAPSRENLNTGMEVRNLAPLGSWQEVISPGLEVLEKKAQRESWKGPDHEGCECQVDEFEIDVQSSGELLKGLARED